MKKILSLVIMSFMLIAGITIVGCNSDNNDYGNQNVEESELNGFFSSREYENFSNTFEVNNKNFEYGRMVVNYYKKKNVKTFCIPINKDGNEVGQVLILSKNNGSIYKVLYEDRRDFTSKDGGVIKITTSTNKYIASINCKKIDSHKMIMRIADVSSTKAIKTRVEMPSPDEGWWDCTTGCYKVAKEACGTDAECDFICDLADLANGCTITVAAACAIYCI